MLNKPSPSKLHTPPTPKPIIVSLKGKERAHPVATNEAAADEAAAEEAANKIVTVAEKEAVRDEAASISDEVENEDSILEHHVAIVGASTQPKKLFPAAGIKSPPQIQP